MVNCSTSLAGRRSLRWLPPPSRAAPSMRRPASARIWRRASPPIRCSWPASTSIRSAAPRSIPAPAGRAGARRAAARRRVRALRLRWQEPPSTWHAGAFVRRRQAPLSSHLAWPPPGRPTPSAPRSRSTNGRNGAPDLLARAASIAGSGQIWIVARGGVPLPVAGNALISTGSCTTPSTPPSPSALVLRSRSSHSRRPHRSGRPRVRREPARHPLSHRRGQCAPAGSCEAQSTPSSSAAKIARARGAFRWPRRG